MVNEGQTCGEVKHMRERAVSKTRVLGISLRLSERFRFEIELSISSVTVGLGAWRLEASEAKREVISGNLDIDGDAVIFPPRTVI